MIMKKLRISTQMFDNIGFNNEITETQGKRFSIERKT